VERIPNRIEMSKKMGADVVLNPDECDVIEEIKKLTDGRGVDVGIEALGTQTTFEGALRATRVGGVVSSLGIYESNLTVPLDAYVAGLSDVSIVSCVCPGGTERMRRLISVIESGRADLTPLITHTMPLEDIKEGYRIFGGKLDNVLKVAIKP
jgi:threonine dehydrogenase-like Zn-dependent dehydrogenase